jgi:hypothetical protein
MVEAIERIKSVRPAGGLSLAIRFEGDRARHVVDLTGIISRSRHFAPLLDPAVLSGATTIEDGLGIGWPVETRWGQLDLSADTLRRIAEEQRPMTGAEFAKWREALGLSLTEAANLLGLGRRTVMSYLKKDELPAVVAIACRALARDENLFAAHYIPGRKPGRKAA